MSKPELAVSCFKEGFLCSQALLSTYGAELGLDRETALRISAAFGGGMARLGEVCGSVSGAFLILSLKYGHIRADDSQAKEETYNKVREFAHQFKSRHGSIVCRDLLGCDIGTPVGLKLAKEKNLFSTVCPGFVRDAAEIIEQVL